MPESDPIAITGCGWVTPFAHGDIETVLRAVSTAIRPSATPDGYWAVPGEFLDAYAFPNEIRQDKSAWLPAIAVEWALRSARLSKGAGGSDRVGMVLGTTHAGPMGMIRFAEEVRAQGPRFVSPIHFPQTVGNYPAGALARALGNRGPNLTLACGEASGLQGVQEACGILRRNEADVMLVGGSEALSLPLVVPTDGREFIPAEGACFLVLERLSGSTSRGANAMALVEPGTLDDGPRSHIAAGVPHAEKGHVRIAAWVGQCGAALGAAAVAACLGAAMGASVPVAEEDGDLIVRRFFEDGTGEPEATRQALMYAEDRFGRRSHVRLVFSNTGR